MMTRKTEREAIWTIIQVVAALHKLSAADILGESRKAPIVRARHTCFAFARRITGASYPRLGIYFQRSHDVIMRGIARHEQRIGHIRFRG